MKLNQDRINELEQLQERLYDDLVRQRPRCRNDRETADLEKDLVRVKDKQAALAGIVTRNMQQLTNVTRNVFVSTRFKNGAPPPWLNDVFNEVNATRARGHFKPVYGKAPEGGNFLMAILEKMAGCHFFLCVVPADKDADGTQKRWPVSPYLMEEIGAAFLLPVPVLIALETGCGVKPEEIGVLIPNFQKLNFDRDNIPRTAQDLSQALEAACNQQRALLDETTKALSRFFVS